MFRYFLFLGKILLKRTVIAGMGGVFESFWENINGKAVTEKSVTAVQFSIVFD